MAERAGDGERSRGDGGPNPGASTLAVLLIFFPLFLQRLPAGAWVRAPASTFAFTPQYFVLPYHATGGCPAPVLVMSRPRVADGT